MYAWEVSVCEVAYASCPALHSYIIHMPSSSSSSPVSSAHRSSRSCGMAIGDLRWRTARGTRARARGRPRRGTKGAAALAEEAQREGWIEIEERHRGTLGVER